MRRNLPFLISSAIVLAILLSLGNWQLRRMGEKTAYIEAIKSKIAAAPVAVPANASPEQDQFLAVTMRGAFVGPEIHLLVSTRDLGAGYRIVQAFETEGRRVMVDRGFVFLTNKDKPRPHHEARVSGNLHWPEERDSYTPENDAEGNIWFARDVPLLASALDTEEFLVVAHTTDPNDPSIQPLPLDTSSIPNRHLEYIITWYGLAATWVIMSLYFLKRRSKKDD